MWRVKFRAVPIQNCGILWCSARVRFSNWIWNQGPKYLRGPEAKPGPSNQLETDSTWIKQGFTKWLQKGFGLLRKQYIRRIIIITINHLQDGICHHGCCRCLGAKQAPGHQQPPCCKYRLFTRFHWKLICEDNRPKYWYCAYLTTSHYVNKFWIIINTMVRSDVQYKLCRDLALHRGHIGVMLSQTTSNWIAFQLLVQQLNIIIKTLETLVLCEVNPSVTAGFPSQRASNLRLQGWPVDSTERKHRIFQ